MLSTLKLALLTITSLWRAPEDVQPPCRTQLWDVPPIDTRNNNTGGWSELPTTSHVKIWDGASHDRTYAHHPIIEVFGDTVAAIWSSAEVDEDSNGQSIIGAISKDQGRTWSSPEVIIPGALLPNQTDERTFNYWCSNHISQRAWQSVSLITSPQSHITYAVAVSTCFQCSPESEWNYSAGRVARPLNLQTGVPAGEPCWLNQNELTESLEFQNTVYGTKYGMKYCEERDVLNELLARPENVPAWHASLYNHDYFAVDHVHVLGEVTHAVWDESAQHWQRFWRDESPTQNTWSVWTECTRDPSSWFPNDLPLDGNLDQGSDAAHEVYKTNIPDAKTKQYFGFVITTSAKKIRYLVSNPRTHDSNLNRFPLTLAWQGIDDDERNWTFKNIGVVQTYPDPNPAPETRDQYKNPGFSYPSAVQVGENLLVVYSENKENIWLSSIPIDALLDW